MTPFDNIPFPMKLYHLLEIFSTDSATNENPVIGWLIHGKSFCIFDPKNFEEEVIPEYFNQSKIASFQRQLNLYGFHRICIAEEVRGSYYHPSFQRGRIDLLPDIRRSASKVNKVSKAEDDCDTDKFKVECNSRINNKKQKIFPYREYLNSCGLIINLSSYSSSSSSSSQSTKSDDSLDNTFMDRGNPKSTRADLNVQTISKCPFSFTIPNEFAKTSQKMGNPQSFEYYHPVESANLLKYYTKINEKNLHYLSENVTSFTDVPYKVSMEAIESFRNQELDEDYFRKSNISRVMYQTDSISKAVSQVTDPPMTESYNHMFKNANDIGFQCQLDNLENIDSRKRKFESETMIKLSPSLQEFVEIMQEQSSSPAINSDNEMNNSHCVISENESKFDWGVFDDDYIQLNTYNF